MPLQKHSKSLTLVAFVALLLSFGTALLLYLYVALLLSFRYSFIALFMCTFIAP